MCPTKNTTDWSAFYLVRSDRFSTWNPIVATGTSSTKLMKQLSYVRNSICLHFTKVIELFVYLVVLMRNTFAFEILANSQKNYAIHLCDQIINIHRVYIAYCVEGIYI